MPWLCSIILLPLNLIFCEAYTNSLLANLNARKSIGAIGRPNDNFSFNSDFFKTSPGTQVRRKIYFFPHVADKSYSATGQSLKG